MSCATPLPLVPPPSFFLSASFHHDLALHSPFSCSFAAPNPSKSDFLISKHLLPPQNSPRKTLHAFSLLRSDLPKSGDNTGNQNKTGNQSKAGQLQKNGCPSTDSLAVRRKRPARLVIPESARLASLDKAQQFAVTRHNTSVEEIHSYEAPLFGVSCKKGRKPSMEDAYTATTNCQGNIKQAFFGVFDGHGGKHAADFAAENLGRHISVAIQNQEGEKRSLEDAMHMGYMATDAEFLHKHVSSGACSVSAFLKEGQIVVANAGDCKAVLCRSGKAESLSTLHCASDDAERQRVENLGGYIDSFYGVWRVQGTLAVTRGFGDANLKQWMSAEPAVKKLDITQGCEFLILASDGLWDQMSDQEAVDCARKILIDSDVLNERLGSLNSTATRSCNDDAVEHPLSVPIVEERLAASTWKTDACNKLIHMASKRGNRDDITVMIVLLQSFCIA